MKPYYERDGITIYHGDCREILPGLVADALVTDPPYGVSLGSHKAASETRSGYLVKSGYLSYDDTDENLRSIVVPSIIAALQCVNGRGIVFCAGNKIGAFPEPSCVGGVYLPAGCGRTRWGFQNLSLCMFYGVAPDLKNGARATVIVGTASAEPSIHPCPKPLAWMTWAVGLASCDGETVLDPFMGSGTTLVAARDMRRRAIGIEIEERYCEVAAKRLAQNVLPFFSESS